MTQGIPTIPNISGQFGISGSHIDTTHFNLPQSKGPHGPCGVVVRDYVMLLLVLVGVMLLRSGRGGGRTNRGVSWIGQ